MSSSTNQYYQDARHPWSSVLFVLPLLTLYEVSLLTFTPETREALRNGADTWLHWVISQVGLGQSYWPGIIIGAALITWAWMNTSTRPKDLPNVWMGMVVESALLAMALWVLSLSLGPFIDYMGIPLYTGDSMVPALVQILSFLGAGIYEEILFRLILLSLLVALFSLGDIPKRGAIILWILSSSLIFAAAHHVGPAGEAVDQYVFLFRTLAGCFFAILFQLRGFGIAVGAHAFYDVLVGVVLPAIAV